jgi:hypothetical protein
MWKSLDIYTAPAFRKMPQACAEFIAYLEVQYMLSAGTENRRLIARYEDLVSWGIHISGIKRAIDEAERRGLIEVTRRGAFRGYANSLPSLYP